MDQVISSGEPPRFVVCLRNDDWPMCLQVRKVYRVLPDEPGERSGWIRVIDETDEDYLYPAEYFHALELSPDVAQALLNAKPVEDGRTPSPGG